MPGELRNGGGRDEEEDMEEDVTIDLDVIDCPRLHAAIRGLNNEITRLRRSYGNKPHYILLKEALSNFYTIIVRSEAFDRNRRHY
jgi:hypothetical protein